MESSLISSLLTMLVATIFVLALAWGSLALLRRSRLTERLGGADKAAELIFVRALPVGQRERLVVVRYKGQQLLLGVTGGSITLLQRDGLPAPFSGVLARAEAAAADVPPSGALPTGLPGSTSPAVPGQ